MVGLRWAGAAIAGSVLLLGLVGCAVSESWADGSKRPDASSPESGSSVEPPDSVAQTPNAPLPAVDPEVVAAQTRFGFSLFSQVVQQSDGDNLMISPSSVALALAMLYNGANGETQEAMANALSLRGLSVESLNQANQSLMTVLENADPKVKLAIANSLWARRNFPFEDAFLQANQAFYEAEVSTLDFSDRQSVETINDWVSRNTEGKIPTIIDQINPDDVMFIINAIYFNGTWQRVFDARQTSNQPFYLADGSQKSHPMMRQDGGYLYLENNQFQAVQLPYGNGRLSMVIVLPQQSLGLDTFLSILTPDNWQTWQEQFSFRAGAIQLPRFKSEFSVNLNTALQAMGMDVAFDPSAADFSGLSAEPTYVSRVQHKTLIDVNERGTEAAAVTSIGVTTTSMPMNPFQMTCDRPFFYAIQDNETGSILFMGTVVNPET
ncbi:serpin family protein [Leptolyngbya sp. AN02str]|uniref:serpin family protein n=1 Tax=Leptolyngbya sp. AN02str TaxID=3423363 RepID=UPI003D321D39